MIIVYAATLVDFEYQALYRHAVRNAWQKIPGQGYQAKTVDVTLNDEHIKYLFVQVLQLDPKLLRLEAL